MSSFWHWFVIAGVVGSLLAMLALMYGNRKTSDKETTGHEWDGITELDNPLPMWWVGLFVGTVLFAVPFLLYFPGLGSFQGVGGWSAASQLDEDETLSERRFRPLYARLGRLTEDQLHSDREARNVGRRLFINYCSTCHGVNGGGAAGIPNLTDNVWLWGDGLDQVKTAIRNGRIAAMPPWEAALGEDGLTQVTEYVLKLSGNDHDAVAADTGKARYDVFCVACHGAEGTGNPVLGAPDLTNNVWLYGGTFDAIRDTLANGRNGNMPAHGDRLSTEQIHVLAGYVTSLNAN